MGLSRAQTSVVPDKMYPPSQWALGGEEDKLRTRTPSCFDEVWRGSWIAVLRSPNLYLSPSSPDFVGKEFDLRSGELSNKQVLLIGLLILWFLLVLGDLSRKGMERLLRRSEWALRPSAGSGAFLAGAYRWNHSDSPRVNKGLIRPILTATYFAVIPRCFRNCPKVQLWLNHGR